MPYVTEGASPITVHALRLRPGEDLRAELEAFARARELAAAFVVASVGSLAVARLRYAGRDEAVELCGDLELVALSGTISRDGDAHLHAAVADADGSVTGGHVLAGSVVRTTAEIETISLQPARFKPSMLARKLMSDGGMRWPRSWRGRNTSSRPASLPNRNWPEGMPNGLSIVTQRVSVRPGMS